MRVWMSLALIWQNILLNYQRHRWRRGVSLPLPYLVVLSLAWWGIYAISFHVSSFFGFMMFVCLFKFLVDNRKLCEAPYHKTVDWAKWYIFWADERVVGKTHADSNYKLAKDGLLSKVCAVVSFLYIHI